MAEEKLEAIVIGTGFGGAISACRLSKKWPGKVMVLERGKRYPMGTFPRSPHDFSSNFWYIPAEKRPAFKEMGDQEAHGVYDIRSYDHMDVIQGAGLGGTSLIYANVFLLPPQEIFDQRWPDSCKKKELLPYYAVAKEVLGSRPVPGYDNQGKRPAKGSRRQIIRTELFEHVAKRIGAGSKLTDLNVFFGNDPEKPLEMGLQDKNRYGATQTSCVYCAECMAGCNYHSKNTVDLNYLFVAENCHGAKILTECLVEAIVPVDENGHDHPEADGTHGYRVYYWDLGQGSVDEQRRTKPDYHSLPCVLAKRVILSAGSLGSTELLLRNKIHFRTLTRVSSKLGERFSGNGDFLSFVFGSSKRVGSNYGPVITRYIDHGLFEKFDRKGAFITEDASYPTFAAWFLEGIRPVSSRIPELFHTIVDVLKRLIKGRNDGRVGYAFRAVLGGDLSDRIAVQLCMGVDESDGTMTLDGKDHRLRLDWPYQNSKALYRKILRRGQQFARVVRARKFLPLLTWAWPFRRNVTVHPLGGCSLAMDEKEGVTNADRTKFKDPETGIDRTNFGEVFGYKGLYVADGALCPSAVGANPCATIAALSEMVAEGITGEAPCADLRGDEAGAPQKGTAG